MNVGGGPTGVGMGILTIHCVNWYIDNYNNYY